MNDRVLGRPQTESTLDDKPHLLLATPPLEALSIESLAALSARVQALQSRLDVMEPAIREVRHRANTLIVHSLPIPSSKPYTHDPQDGQLLVNAATNTPPAADHSTQTWRDGTSKIRRNLVSLFLSQVATMIIALVTVTIVPKYLGPQSFGALTFAITFIGLFAAILLLGSNQFLVKTIARDRSDLGAYVFNGLVMKLALGLLLAIIAIAVTHFSPHRPQTVLLIEIGCIGMILVALNDILTAALQGVQKMGRSVVWTGIQQYTTTALAIGLLIAHKGVVLFFLITTIGTIIPLVANGYHLWPEMRGRLNVDLGLWRAMAVGGMPFFLWSALLLVYGSIDIVMLQAMTSSDVVGWYGLAYRWVGIPVALPVILSTVILPSLSSLALTEGPEFSRLVNRAIQVALFAAIPMAVGIALVAGDIVRMLHYPAGFEHSIPLMRILAVHIPVVALDMVLAIAITAKDRQKAWLVVGCVAVVFNPAMNLIAIPFTSHRFGNGAIGASIVTVATELLMMVGAIYMRPAGVLDRKTILFVLRCAAAAAIMIPAVELVARQPFGVKVLTGMAAFACGAWALRLISVRQTAHTLLQATRRLRDRSHQAFRFTRNRTKPAPANRV